MRDQTVSETFTSKTPPVRLCAATKKNLTLGKRQSFYKGSSKAGASYHGGTILRVQIVLNTVASHCSNKHLTHHPNI